MPLGYLSSHIAPLCWYRPTPLARMRQSLNRIEVYRLNYGEEKVQDPFRACWQFYRSLTLKPIPFAVVLGAIEPNSPSGRTTADVASCS